MLGVCRGDGSTHSSRTGVPAARRGLALLVLAAVIAISPGSEGGEPLRVLFISSRHPAVPTFFQQVEGVHSVFPRESSVVDVEFTGSRRVGDEASAELSRQLLARRLASASPYSVVLTGDDSAFRFALTHRDTLKGAPLVFFGVNDRALAAAQAADPLMTGVVESVSMRDTLHLILQLHPRVNRIVAVVDGTSSGQGHLKTFHEAGSRLRSVSLTDLSLETLTFEELGRALGSLSDGDAVLLLSACHDREGATMGFAESLALIRGSLERPLYHLWYHGFGQGVLGGRVVCHFDQAQAAARVALDVAEGRAPPVRPVLGESPNRYVFDYAELRRFHVEMGLLPRNHRMINAPDTARPPYVRAMLAAGAAVLGLVAVACAVQLYIIRRRRADQARRASEQRLRGVFENLSLVAVILDAKGRVVFCNSYLLSLTNQSREEVLGNDWFETFLPPRERDTVRSVFLSIVSTGTFPVNFENPIRTREGEERLIEWNNSALRKPNGRVIEVVSIGRDVTEARRVEAALQESEHRFREIAENVRDIFWLRTPTRMLYINPAFEQVWGMPHARLLEDVTAYLDAVHPADRERVRQAAENADEQSMDEEYRIVRPDGSIRWIHARAFPVAGMGDGEARSAGIAEDVTDQKRVEEALGQRNVELETLHRISEISLRAESREAALTDIVDLISQVSGYPCVAVESYDRERDVMVFESARGVPLPPNGVRLEIPCHETFSGEAVRRGEPVVEFGAGENPLYVNPALRQLNVQTLISIPMTVEGRVVGALTLARPDRAVVDEDAVRRLEDLASHVSMHVERKRAEEALSQSEWALSISNRVATIFLTVPEGEIHAEVLRVVLDALESPQGYFAHIDEAGALVCSASAHGDSHGGNYDAWPTALPSSEWTGVWGRSLERRRTFCVKTPQTMPFRADTLTGLLAVPIVHHGDVVGQFVAASKPGGYSPADTELLEAIATQVAPILSARLSARRHEQGRLRLSTAIDQAAETVLITDTCGVIEYASAAVERNTGYSAEELVGRNVSIFESGETDAAVLDELWATIRRGEVWIGQVINRRKDGASYREEATISPVRDTVGHIVGYVSAQRDVTYETELEAQLRQSQKMEAIGQLAGGVAHDFNNLLQVIRGYSDMVVAELPEDAPSRPMLQEVIKGADRATALVRQLLTFSRREALEAIHLDVSDLVADLVKMLRRLLGEHVELTVQTQPTLRPVYADPGQLEQIVVNLCVNARDAMPDGGHIRVETREAAFGRAFCETHPWARQGEFVAVSVADTGSGMDEAIVSRIFEPFFTTKEHGSGTGLGLATVYAITQRHEGLLHVESEPGQGTAVTVYLPAAAAHSADGRHETPVEEGTVEGHGTVLLAEDDEMVRDLAGRVLRGAGYAVVEAKDGDEAVALFRQHQERIRLAVLDVVMPKRNGRKVYDAIAEGRPGLPVIFSSGYSRDELDQAQLPDGNHQILRKPYKMHDLLKTARQLTDGEGV